MGGGTYPHVEHDERNQIKPPHLEKFSRKKYVSWEFVGKKTAASFSIPRETNVAPENRPSQKESSLPTIHFQVRAVQGG